MNARQKLNISHFNGSFIIATIAGIAWQSWGVFFGVLIAGVLISLCVGEIRPNR